MTDTNAQDSGTIAGPEIDHDDSEVLGTDMEERNPQLRSRPKRDFSWRSQQYGGPDPRFKSPFLAAFLSFVPGLGQIYVGYYTRGFINPLAIGAVLSMLIFSADDRNPPFWFPLAIMFIVFFWLYNIIDAWRRAVMYNLALEGFENIPLPDDMSAPGLGGSLFGGVVLVLIGLLTLLHTKFGLPAEIYEQWWPIAPIGFGAYLIIRSWMDKKKTEVEG